MVASIAATISRCRARRLDNAIVHASMFHAVKYVRLSEIVQMVAGSWVTVRTKELRIASLSQAPDCSAI
jgi:hypothetical protein